MLVTRRPLSGFRRLAHGMLLAATILVSSRGTLTVANLNCTFLVSPATAAQIGLKPGNEISQYYSEKFDNLAKLIRSSGAEFVGLQTVGAKRELEDLATRLSGLSGDSWQGIFIPGASRHPARNLAVVYRPRRGLQVTGAGPIQDLGDVPNHLVFTLTVDGTAYAICLVDLTAPDGPPATAATATQLRALQTWARQQAGTAVIMGTFNEERRKLPPLFSVNERLGWPATELGNRGRDYIYSTRMLALGAVIAPPYGTDPVAAVRARWTDHFLVTVLVP